MLWRLEGGSEALRSPIPWVALTAALALTYAGCIAVERSNLAEARTQFERRTESAEAAIRTRLLSYEQVLRSGAARIASAPSVSRAEWHDFVAQLQLDDRFPGIQAIGFAERATVAGQDKVTILYNEPQVGRNIRVLGFDMYAEPTRRAAMDRARDTGEVAISGKVVLAGEAYRGAQAQQPGFVMYVPVYRREPRGLTATERREALTGFVFSPFRMLDLMRGTLDEESLRQLDIRVFDEPGPAAATELIDTRTAWRPAASQATPAFTREVSFQMPGRLWTMRFASRPEFDAAIDSGNTLVIFTSGALASLVLFILTLALVAAWNRAHYLSVRDPLTSLFNRRYLDETMDRELPRARRRGESIGVIVIDIDNFKNLNDTYGHDAGDFVLERVADILRANTRNSDIPCRFGGEEFAVILPGATLTVARQRAEAIRAALESSHMEFGGKRLAPLTLSAGVTALPPHANDWGESIHQADRALYTAKQGGRNRVIVAADD
jgi:diguanylate cyclase (GGDEF)-like protein